MRRRLAGLALAGVMLAAAPLAPGGPAARQAPDHPEAAASVQGMFLVARPSMSDPRFANTVILMIRHDRKGAFGLVINKPLGVAEITERKPAAGADAEGKPAKVLRLPTHYGGPVQPEMGFVVHSPEYSIKGTVRVTAEVAMTATAAILGDIARGRGPKKLLYVVGYAGWRADQLEDEMRRNGWFTAPADAELLFGDGDGAAKWRRAVEMRFRNI